MVLATLYLGYLLKRWLGKGDRASLLHGENSRRARQFKRKRSMMQKNMFDQGFHKMESASLPSGTTQYLLTPKVENGEGLVVIVHGFGMFSFVFQNFVEDLVGAKRQVLIYDTYGHGFSETSTTTYNMDLFLTQFKELLEYLELDHVTFSLFGHSMGGLLSAEIARRYPEKVEQLALLCPAGSSTINLSDCIKNKRLELFLIHLFHRLVILPVLGNWILRLLSLFSRRVLGERGTVPALELLSGKLSRIDSNHNMRPTGNRFVNMNAMVLEGFFFQARCNSVHVNAFQSILKNMNLMGNNAHVFAGCREAMLSYRAAGQKKGTAIQKANAASVSRDRIVIFWGTDDEYIPYEHVHKLKEIIPEAVIVSFPDCDHFLFLNRPAEFSAAALRFLRGEISRSPSAPIVNRMGRTPSTPIVNSRMGRMRY